MKYDPLLKPEYLNLGFEIRNHSTVSEEIERTEEHQRQLKSRFSTGDKNMIFSPTAINMWLNCRMKFYYRYVCGLKEPESITEDIDPALLGTLLHETMKNLYQGFIGKRVSASSIDTILSDKQSLLKLINRTIREVFSRENDTAAIGNELIVTEVLMVYVGRILEADRMSSSFVIEDLEKPVRFSAVAGEGESTIRLLAGGNIDRIDIKDGITRILDYKTGAIADSISSVSDLFNEKRKKDYDGWLQTLLYCEGYLHEEPGSVVRPSVYKVKKAPGENLADRLLIKEGKGEEIPVDDYSTVRHEFMLGLESIVNTIFKSNEPFIMTSDIWGKCSYCPYSRLCLRQ
jgi:hypothetical protein